MENLNTNLDLKKELQELKNLTLLGAKNVLTMNDVSILTGLSKSHLYKLTHTHRIPHWKNRGGKITYFNKNEIENWLLYYRVKTTDEIESEAANYLIKN
jgi:excisionase family DNA binding protein